MCSKPCAAIKHDRAVSKTDRKGLQAKLWTRDTHVEESGAAATGARPVLLFASSERGPNHKQQHH